LTGKVNVKVAHNTRRPWAPILIGMALAALPAQALAQVSLATVVDLAQRNSSTVKLAEADVQKAQAALSQTKDVFIPGMMLGSGLSCCASIGFTGTPPSIASASLQSLVFSFPRYSTSTRREPVCRPQRWAQGSREQVTLDASIAYIDWML